MDLEPIPTLPLGQAGFRLAFGSTVVYIDPYLSSYVEKVEGPRSRRLIPIPLAPEQIEDADWVLVTHAHIDHCDPETLVPLSKASPGCRIIASYEARDVLASSGVETARLATAEERWAPLGHDLSVRAVPAAHPEVERNAQGHPRCVGYLLRYRGRLVYHAGDTSVSAEIIETVRREGPPDTAILPVNERNYFRDRLGILGNMSVREAFELALEIGARAVVPMHWDMFRLNSVFREEIELLYDKLAADFQLRINPKEI